MLKNIYIFIRKSPDADPDTLYEFFEEVQYNDLIENDRKRALNVARDVVQGHVNPRNLCIIDGIQLPVTSKVIAMIEGE